MAEELDIKLAVDELLAACEQQQLRLPEMQALYGKRHDAADLHPALARLLMALGAEWRAQGSSEAGQWLGPALGAALPALWQGLAPAQRAALPQYPRLLQLMADLGLHTLLADVAEPLEALLREPGALPVVRSLLRQARQQRLVALGARLLEAWAPQWRPGLPWSNDLVMLLGVVARDADQLTLLRGLYRWAQPMHAALARPELPAELRTLLLRRLPAVASRTLDMAAMQGLCLAAPAALDALNTLEDALAWMPMLNVLHHFDPLAPVEPVLERLAARHPLDPRVQLLRARMIAESGSATPEQLTALMAPLPPDGPGYAKAALWLARNLFYLDAQDDALAWYLRASEAEPLPAAEAARLAHLSVKLAPEPAEALSAALQTRRLEAEEYGALAPALAQLEALMNLDPAYETSPPAAQLQQRMESSLQALAAALPGFEELNAQWALDFGRALCNVADATYQRTAQFLTAILVPTSPDYGTLDPQRCKALLDGVSRHVLRVGREVLEREADWLQGINHLRVVLDLVDLMVDRLLRLDEPDGALALLAQVQARLGVSADTRGPADTVLWAMVQRCELERGDLPAAALAGQRAGQGDRTQVLALRHWGEWTEALAAAPTGGPKAAPEHPLLADDPVLAGHYDYLRADGVLRTVAHWIPAVRVEMVATRELLVRNSYALIGDPAGPAGMLLPEPWHLSMGRYPYRHASVLSRGQRGTCMVRAAAPERVAQPLVVLGNMDAIVHRNYYHWMLLILPRIDALQRRGLLAQRKLLIPEELSSWMKLSLALIGVQPEQMLTYRQEQDLLLADALVVQPIEFTSPTLVNGLAETLHAAARAHTELPAHDHPLVFISRRQAMDRPLLDEDRIMATAQAMGFEIVQPELLSLPEQVRLFGNARGLAGPPGAGFSNLMFAGVGARVLAIFKEEESQAPFVDLSLARGQHHRWVLGRTEDEFRRSSLLSGPYRVDHDLVQRQLAWVAEAAR